MKQSAQVVTTNAMPLLRVSGIGKNFGAVRALDDVSLDLRPGEVHALVGENGAGKTTLIKILGGVYPWPQYEGEILVGGASQRFTGVADARRAGIVVLHQELSLVPEMSVAENIYLGRQPHRFGVVQADAMLVASSRALEEIGADILPETPARALGVGQQQMVEIAKALSQEARALVLDEPTAALTEVESDRLFCILRELTARGVGVLYISHRLEEVFRISQRITVLREGRAVGTIMTQETDAQRVIASMVGREISQVFPARGRRHDDIGFEVRGLTVRGRGANKLLVNDVSFAVRRGEVLGVAGLMGAGRTEMLKAIFGAMPHVSGEVHINGRRVRITSPADAIAAGIGLVTDDRKGSGLMLAQSVMQNITLAALRQVSGRFITDTDRELAVSEQMRRDLQIKTASLTTAVGALSGGNQQKVVLSKWLLTRPSVLLLDEPTRGIDVGAKQEIYARIAKLAEQGMAIVFVSSELEEVLGMSDRILVIREGRVAGEFAGEAATAERIMACATGHVAPLTD